KDVGIITTTRCSRRLAKGCWLASTTIWRIRIRSYFFFCAHLTENKEGNSSSKQDPDPAWNTAFFLFLSCLSFRGCSILIISQCVGSNCTNGSTRNTRSNHTTYTWARFLLGCSTRGWSLLCRCSLTRLLIRLSRRRRTLHTVAFTATGTFCFSSERCNQ